MTWTVSSVSTPNFISIPAVSPPNKEAQSAGVRVRQEKIWIIGWRFFKDSEADGVAQNADLSKNIPISWGDIVKKVSFVEYSIAVEISSGPKNYFGYVKCVEKSPVKDLYISLEIMKILLQT